MCKKILIAGFSGAGKSSLLKALQTNPPQGWVHFDDLDQLVLQKHGIPGRPLSDLIGHHGWEKFRLWERQELERWLKQENSGVLSLGGGSLSGPVATLLQSMPGVKLVYLHADFETCWQRLLGDTHEPRPLVQKGKEELRAIYRERQKHYQLAPLRLSNQAGTNISDLAAKFWEEVLGP